MGNEFELSLELSIGGCYGKANDREKTDGKSSDASEGNTSGSDFSCGKIELGAVNASESADLREKGEMEVLGRREAPMKKSRGLLTLTEDKLILEGQQFQTRVEERECREKEEFARKREKNGAKRHMDELNVSVSGDEFVRRQTQAQFLLPQVQYLPIGNGYSYPWIVPLWSPNSVEGGRNEKNMFEPVGNQNGSRNSSVDLDSVNRAAVSNRSGQRSSSVVSDYRSLAQKGGSSSEAESHSSCVGTHNESVLTSDKIEHLDVNHSPHGSSGQCPGQLNPDQTTKVGPILAPQSNSNPSIMAERSKECAQSDSTMETCSVIAKPPKPPSNNQKGASVQQMPCVSTTGNGPNGKTITGFLYKYTKTEVCIMCVCHGSSFSPAEFVKHAGGVDVAHPLKHITIVPVTL